MTVFIIEDNADMRAALDMMIASLGCRTRSFGSAEAFLNTYVPSSNDFLVLDLHMRGMSGATLLEELRARGEPVAAVLITAQPEEALVRRALTAGAMAVLTKPFEIGELVPFLEQALAAPQH